jgi:hypothetical protein
MTTRKTLAFPIELANRIQAEADTDDRSFSNVVVHRLRQSFFSTRTVRQSTPRKRGAEGNK